MAHSPFWKLRRQASRSIKVFGRHSAVPSIGAYASSIVPTANAMIGAYDAVRAYQATWKREMGEGRGAMKVLLENVNLWKPHVARENPSFDLSAIADRPDVPEDLIEDALRLATELGNVRAGGAAPEWATAAKAGLVRLTEAAERETDEAAAADARWTELQRALDSAASAFDATLQNFRRGLRAALKRSHPDYQKLRAEKAAERDEDDDPNAPQPAPAVTPAPTPPR